MKKDTILLGLEKYNELRDFKKEITAGNVLVYYRTTGLVSTTTISYYTNEEVAKELGRQKDVLKEEKRELKKEISKLKEKLAGIDKPKHKRRSFLGFIIKRV